MSNRFTEQLDAFGEFEFYCHQLCEILQKDKLATTSSINFQVAYWHELNTGISELATGSQWEQVDSNCTLLACFLAEIDDEDMDAFLQEYFHE